MSLTYKKSGVDIYRSSQIIKNIQKNLKNMNIKCSELILGIGGFSALIKIPKNYQNPILVTSVDGVGSKLNLSIKYKLYQSIGIDLVAMVVNDIIVYGAKPWIFFDYYSANQLHIKISNTIMKSIIQGCKKSQCTLVGGETSEIPTASLKKTKNVHLAGFGIGLVEKKDIIDGSKIQIGDVLIGLKSSGIHSNGYTLIKKILDINLINIKSFQINNRLLKEYLFIPTKIYVKDVLFLVKKYHIHGIVHITGGGILKNIIRIVPKNGYKIIINTSSWEWPFLFKWIQKQGKITTQEMYNVFNCGIGMIIIVPKYESNSILKELNILGQKAWEIGNVIHNSFNQSKVVLY
ncbi:MAG: phosphoribosylformylglycinamidine cyclo-ligase [Arsenophonus sp.]|nr:MAG: phosphoribosylformylglycinamidine cyclo-ligase [Arsenophonus sp.]